jgi:type IV pilus assembly protein PilE
MKSLHIQAQSLAQVRRLRSRGFTLVELMIVVAIIAILASVAYPSYVEYVARGQRAKLKTQMVLAQQWMERFYSENYRYDQTAAGVANTFGSQAFRQSPPPDEGAATYTLAMDRVGDDDKGQTYIITATRVGTMASDRCGAPSVTNTGVKDVTGYDENRYTSAAAAIADCWR